MKGAARLLAKAHSNRCVARLEGKVQYDSNSMHVVEKRKVLDSKLPRFMRMFHYVTKGHSRSH